MVLGSQKLRTRQEQHFPLQLGQLRGSTSLRMWIVSKTVPCLTLRLLKALWLFCTISFLHIQPSLILAVLHSHFCVCLLLLGRNLGAVTHSWGHGRNGHNTHQGGLELLRTNNKINPFVQQLMEKCSQCPGKTEKKKKKREYFVNPRRAGNGFRAAEGRRLCFIFWVSKAPHSCLINPIFLCHTRLR